MVEETTSMIFYCKPNSVCETFNRKQINSKNFVEFCFWYHIALKLRADLTFPPV